MPESASEGKNLAHALTNILLMLTVMAVSISIFAFALNKLNAANESTRDAMQSISAAKLQALNELTNENEPVAVTEIASALLEISDIELAYISITANGNTTYYAYDGTLINGVQSTSIHYNDSPYNEAAQALLSAVGNYGYLVVTDFSGAIAISVYY